MLPLALQRETFPDKFESLLANRLGPALMDSVYLREGSPYFQKALIYAADIHYFAPTFPMPFRMLSLVLSKSRISREDREAFEGLYRQQLDLPTAVLVHRLRHVLEVNKI